MPVPDNLCLFHESPPASNNLPSDPGMISIMAGNVVTMATAVVAMPVVASEAEVAAAAPGNPGGDGQPGGGGGGLSTAASSRDAGCPESRGVVFQQPGCGLPGRPRSGLPWCSQVSTQASADGAGGVSVPTRRWAARCDPPGGHHRRHRHPPRRVRHCIWRECPRRKAEGRRGGPPTGRKAERVGEGGAAADALSVLRHCPWMAKVMVGDSSPPPSPLARSGSPSPLPNHHRVALAAAALSDQRLGRSSDCAVAAGRAGRFRPQPNCVYF